MTPNGKVDRKALPEPGAAAGKKAYVAPGSDVEKVLAELWCEVLAVGGDTNLRVGMGDNFFDLGGHSLKATVLAAKIHKELGVEVPLDQIFKTPTIGGLAEYIEGRDKGRGGWEDIEPVQTMPHYPLSPAQKRLYLLHRMNPGGTVYNMPQTIPLADAPEVGKLEEIFLRLIGRHESLRTSFEMVEEKPVQRVHEEIRFKIEEYEAGSFLTKNASTENASTKNASTENALAQSAEAMSALRRNFVRPFDLSRAPLLRVGLVRGKERENVLLIDIHHIITDGTSQNLLKEEFRALYNGEELPVLRLHYKDYACWQNSDKRQEGIKKQEAHWLDVFSGDLPVLELPYDFPRPSVQGADGAALGFFIPPAETAALKELGRENEATLFMVLFSLFTVWLHRLGGQEDVVVGTPAAGRRHADLQRIIGMFVNTLPIRTFPQGEKRFSDFLREVKEGALAAFGNQEYPFESLVEKVSVRRDAGRNPLFDVMLVLQNQADYNRAVPVAGSIGAREQGREYDQPQDVDQGSAQGATERGDFPAGFIYEGERGAHFDITLNVVETGGALYLSLEYCLQLFTPETMERFAGYLKRLAGAVVMKPNCSLDALEMMSPEERRWLIVELNDTAVTFGGPDTLHGMLEAQALKTPGNIAILSMEDGENLTYGELNERAETMACGLRARGIGAGDLAAVMAPASLASLAVIIGILKAGGAYLPIDDGYPDERKKYMLKDSGAKLLLHAGEGAVESGLWEGETLPMGALTVGFSGPIGTPFSKGESGAVRGAVTGDAAYVIYTSGSTGRPKGVMVEHRNVVNTLKARREVYQNTVEDTVLQLFSIGFDGFVAVLFTPLVSGARVVNLGVEGGRDMRRFREAVVKEGITHFACVPALFRGILDALADEELGGLKMVTLAGDVVPADLLALAARRLPGLEIFIEYGVTEGAVMSTFHRFHEGDGRVKIGKPIANTAVYVLSEGDELQPTGVPGELCIAGAGIARGYLNNPTLTAEKFRPFTLPAYRTGDQVRMLADGNLEFLGRMDHQVKIRGFRIETGEIENRLMEYDGVKETVVQAIRDNTGSLYLCAYIVAGAGSGESVETVLLKQHLLKNLPEYMVPLHFVFLEQLPLTAVGKVDRKRLPQPEQVVAGEVTVARDEVEKKLTGLWAEALGMDGDSMGIDADFFELGGHSLKASLLMARIEKEMGVDLPLMEIFRSPTIRGLAEVIGGVEEQKSTAIEAGEKKEFYPLTAMQKQLYLAHRANRGSTAYNMPQPIPLEGKPDMEKLEWTLGQLIARHESLRTTFVMVDEEPVQRVHETMTFTLGIHVAPGSGESAVRRWIEAFIEPFDLEEGPLFRAAVVEAGDRWLLMVDMHHIISDGTSQAILETDFAVLYKGENLRPLPLQYKDYALWMESEARREVVKQQEAYWLEVFSGPLPVLDLPLDFPRPGVWQPDGATVTFFLDDGLTAALRQVIQEQGITLFMALAGAFTLLLARKSGVEDMVLGVPNAGRNHADLEGVMGLFLKTLPLRFFPAGERTITDYLQEVKGVTLEAFENLDYPFEALVEKVVEVRDRGRNPIYDVMFNLQNQAEWGDVKGGDETGYVHRQSGAKFDLNLRAVEMGQRLFFSLEYCTALFEAGTIDGLLDDFKRVMAAIAGTTENGELRIADLEMISQKSKEEKMSRLFDDLEDE